MPCAGLTQIPPFTHEEMKAEISKIMNSASSTLAVQAPGVKALSLSILYNMPDVLGPWNTSQNCIYDVIASQDYLDDTL